MGGMMSNIDDFDKQWEKWKSAPGFKQKDFSVSTSDGTLKMSLFGPKTFLANMPKLIETVAKAPYNKSFRKLKLMRPFPFYLKTLKILRVIPVLVERGLT